MQNFATIYVLSCGENFSLKVHLWRKNDKYQVWLWVTWALELSGDKGDRVDCIEENDGVDRCDWVDVIDGANLGEGSDSADRVNLITRKSTHRCASLIWIT